MDSSGGVFSNTLQSITTLKLKELSNKRTFFEGFRRRLLLDVQSETDQQIKVQKLLDGVKQCFSVRSDQRGRTIIGLITDRQLEVSLRNLERFLQQAQHDPSISKKLLLDWEQSLVQRLNIQSLQYQYATLYGELVTEWLSSEKRIPAISDNVSEESEAFEKVSGKEKLNQRMQWEHDVFKPHETNNEITKVFLENLFAKDVKSQAFKALEALRNSVEKFEASLSTQSQFNTTTLCQTIEGLLRSDLLTNEKRTALKGFMSNKVILSEIADVLNMRMSSLEIWGWEGDVVIDQRRHVNGKYKIYMHEDLLQAIFLQYIGVKWSVFFKSAFLNFMNTDGAWVPSGKPIPKVDRKRREYFLGTPQHTSIQYIREELYRSSYFMSKLLDFETQDLSVEDGAEDADFEPTMAASKPKKRVQMIQALADNEQHEVEYSDEENVLLDFDMSSFLPPKNPMKIKQNLLHLVSTEIIVNTELYGEFTCIRSEFSNWGQTLPHSTITSVLAFLGVSSKWLGFFLKFLQTPLKFQDDEVSAQSRVRQRGVPEVHVLSDVFGEVVLFCLDFSTNQATAGGRLYRMHDEFWFWSSSREQCVQAWATVQRFGLAMGVSLNEHKTGSKRIFRNKEESPSIDSALPDGDIRWGFLCLDSEAGRFTIDQALIDIHIQELQRQLQDKVRSIFSMVQAWNTYAGTFFTTNFGAPANCYGQQHVDEILKSLERVQRSIFASNGGIAEYLKATIQERFGVKDIPDGYLYFAADVGGLELKNIFIPFLQIRDVVSENPREGLGPKYTDAEAEAYQKAKAAFENREVPRKVHNDPDFEPEDKDTFMSFEEFTCYREEIGYYFPGNLYDIFKELLQEPKEESFAINHTLRAATKGFAGTSDGTFIWSTMTSYERWIAHLYGPDMMDRFGSLKIVDKSLLPIGMVTEFRSGRVNWQG